MSTEIKDLAPEALWEIFYDLTQIPRPSKNEAKAIEFAKLLEKEGVAYISASVGSYNSIFSKEAIKKMGKTAYLKADMERLTRSVSVPTVISGRIIRPSIAEGLLRDGTVDLIGLGRPLRTDFDWIKKAKSLLKYILDCMISF